MPGRLCPPYRLVYNLPEDEGEEQRRHGVALSHPPRRQQGLLPPVAPVTLSRVGDESKNVTYFSTNGACFATARTTAFRSTQLNAFVRYRASTEMPCVLRWYARATRDKQLQTPQEQVRQLKVARHDKLLRGILLWRRTSNTASGEAPAATAVVVGC